MLLVDGRAIRAGRGCVEMTDPRELKLEAIVEELLDVVTDLETWAKVAKAQGREDDAKAYIRVSDMIYQRAQQKDLRLRLRQELRAEVERAKK